MTVSTDITSVLGNNNDLAKTMRPRKSNLAKESNLSSREDEEEEEEEEEDGQPRVGKISEDRPSGQRDGFLVKYRSRSYDIKNFLRYHPGGKKVLGHLKDRSIDRAFEENPHSKSAFHLLEEFALDARTKGSEHEEAVDWRDPILGQVASLADNYWEWVNLPVDRPIRLFRSDLLEYLSITPWYLVPIVWLPTCMYFLYAGFTDLDHAGGLVGSQIVVSYAAGLLIWTILEYTLHRKLFHFKPPATSRILISLHFLLHGVHHKAPLDDRRLVFPPVVGAAVARGLWEIYKAIFPSTMVCFIAAGTVTGYLTYDLMHYYLHHGSPKSGSYLYTMKRNHNYHHFSHPELGFGICSRLWDHVFKTDIRLRRLAKPIEW